jgi:hypothetical protein
MNNLGLSKKTLGADAVAGVVNAVTSTPDALGSCTRQVLKAAALWSEHGENATSDEIGTVASRSEDDARS